MLIHQAKFYHSLSFDMKKKKKKTIGRTPQFPIDLIINAHMSALADSVSLSFLR